MENGKNRTSRIAVPQRLDLNTAPLMEESVKTDGLDELVLDFSECRYVSSAGIRTIMKLYKSLASSGGSLSCVGVDRAVYEIFEITGFSRLIDIRKKPREISLEGLELLSSGVCGECYRLDAETVVKLYREGIDLSIAEQEKQYARAAFIMGIPTAISYEVVACGSRSGVIYEMLDAEQFSAVIRNDPDRMEAHADTLVNVMNTLHTVKGDRAILPDMKTRFREYLDQLRGNFSEAESRLLRENLESLPDADTCIHFDLHSSNIMIRDGEPMIIDMGDLSIGSYLFDVGLVYTIYGLPQLGYSMLATRIPVDLGEAFWNCFERRYFRDKSPEEYAFFNENRYFLASLRLIYTIVFLPRLRQELIGVVKDFLIPRMMESRLSS